MSIPYAMKAPAESLGKHPCLGQWLQPAPGGRVRATSGKVEIGQGISHALKLIVAEELRLDPDRVEMVPASTASSPDEAVTSGSLSIQHSGAALRAAAAHLREACRERAARRAGIPPAAVQVEDGVFVARALRLGYDELADDALLQEAVDPVHVAPRGGQHSAFATLPRDDIAARVFGEYEYLQDMSLPGMLHGRVFRPNVLQARLVEAAWTALEPRLRALPGVHQVVRDGLLIGVLTQAHHVLERAGRLVEQASPWRGEAPVPAADDVAKWLKSRPLETTTILERHPQGVAPAIARTFRAEYGRGWLQHASIGLCCAVAHWQGEQLRIWSHTQGIFNLRRDLALAFGVPEAAVTVTHAVGAGCYGHNGADDVAFDAAWLARHAGDRPVRLEWTRRQEMGHAPLAPAMAVAVEASVDEAGRLVSWRQEVWSQGHGTRPGRGATPSLLGAWQTASPAPVPLAVNAALAVGGGSERNAVPPYTIDSVNAINHRVLEMPVRVSAMRALGAPVNVMAAESMMDEVARALGRDPLEYRLAHLDDPRARDVLREAARLASWDTAPATRPEGWGRGIAYARYKNTGAYCAVVAEVVVEDEVKLRALHIAADLGLVVHPDGARNQIEGGALQAASWTLREASDIGPEGVRSIDWETYPILGFSQAPAIRVHLVDRPDAASLGAGECSSGPTAAAIANAIDDALGLRLREMPFTAERLVRAAHDT